MFYSELIKAVDYEPEHPIGCPHCGGLYDLRFWGTSSWDEDARCPECGRVTPIAALVESLEERRAS